MLDLDLLFQKSDLIPVIIQDADTKDILMLGFTNKEAVELYQQRGGGADLKNQNRLVLVTQPSEAVEQGGKLRPFPPCEEGGHRLRYRHTALPVRAGRPYLPYWGEELLF